MLKHIDNFEGYVLPGTALSSPAYLGTVYNLWSASSMSITSLASTPENRVTLYRGGTAAAAVTLPLQNHWPEEGAIYFGARMVNFPNTANSNSNVGQFGLARVQSGAFSGVLVKIGFVNRNTLSVSWMDSGIVVEQLTTLVQPIFGNSDYVEFKLVRGEAGQLGQLAIWLNNRLVFDELCIPGNVLTEELHWIALGNLAGRVAGSTGSYVQIGLTLSTVSIPFGVTDFYVVNEEPGLNTGRLGRIRVTGRAPSGDVGPNDWVPYSGATEEDHADILAVTPPQSGKYVSAAAEAQTEMYGGAAFPALGGEQVVGMMTRILASKVDPEGPDLKAVVKSGTTEEAGDPAVLGGTLSYINTVFELNPATSSRWTAAEANNSRFGFTSESAVP